MPPKKYNALPNAVRLFRCDLCAKDYSRQPDYEAHLRSYDHTHRTRMADMKKLTAQNEEQAGRGKKKGAEDMRAVDTGKAGPKFTKIGGGEGVSRFKKVGATVGSDVKPSFTKISRSTESKTIEDEPKRGAKFDADVEMADAGNDDEEEPEQYSWLRPTGCDHANCPGCRVPESFRDRLKEEGLELTAH